MSPSVREHRFIIVGAGPAGLQMAHFLQQAGHDYLVIEASDHVASFFSHFPRHRKLLSINKVHTGKSDPEFNLRHDWNSLLSGRSELLMRNFSKEYFPDASDLVGYMNEFAHVSGVRIQYQRRVCSVRRDVQSTRFELLDSHGDLYRCEYLLIGTGVSRPVIPNVPGIELATGYEVMSTDLSDYAAKSVLIVGKGNSAFETATHLMPATATTHVLSRNPVRLAWETRYVGDLRAVNNEFLDTYSLKSQNTLIDAELENIERAASGKLRVRFRSMHAERETEQLEYDTILRCTGFRFDDSIYESSCRPALTECRRLPAMGSNFESLNVPNMFFIGTLMQSLDYRKSQSGFIHGFRYNVRSLFHMLEQRALGTALPGPSIAVEPRALARTLLGRLGRVSSLWQQVGFMADLIVLPEAGGQLARCYHELPYAYLRDHAAELAGGRDYLIALLRLGPAPERPFDHPRPTTTDQGSASVAIHPVFEYWKPGQGMVQKFEVLEDFLADWSGREYVDSAAQFFAHMQQAPIVAVPPPESSNRVRQIVRDENMRWVDTSP